MLKHYLTSVLILVVLFPGLLAAQSTDAGLGIAKITIKETSFDFGKIIQGKPVIHGFQITNITNAPLTIENVQASCGCTTPEWSKEPIAAGDSSIIRVGYNAAAPGYFEKTITIQYAAGATALLSIKGTVWKTPEQPAPFNKSIAFLKTAKF